MENGTGKRRLGRGLIYIQDHTDSIPQAKIKEKSPKNQSRGLAEEKTAQPAGLGQHGTSSACALSCQHIQKRIIQTQTHTLEPESWVGCVALGHTGEIRPLSGNFLKKLALVKVVAFPQE